MKAVAKTLGVSRFNLHDRLKESAKPRRSCHKDGKMMMRLNLWWCSDGLEFTC